VIHCFTNQSSFDAGKYEVFDGEYSFTSFLTVCGQSDVCKPRIRICAQDEFPTEILFKFVLPVALGLHALSLLAAFALEWLGSFKNMFSVAKKLRLVSPRLYHHVLIENAVGAPEKNLTDLARKSKDFRRSAKYSLEILENVWKDEATLKRLKNQLQGIAEIKENYVWTKCPPMHRAVYKGQLFKWCLFGIMGGKGGAINGQKASSINLITEKIHKKQISLQDQNFITRWWIRRAQRKFGEFALHDATLLEDIWLLEILLENGYDANKIDTRPQKQPSRKTFDATRIRGLAPVHYAANLGSKDCLKVLLDHQANVNSLDTNGRTPLVHAAINRRHACVDYLLKCKADANARDIDEKTSLHYEALLGELKYIKSLINHGADVNAKDITGKTPLHYAASNKHPDCVLYLLQKNADVNSKDCRGNTALLYAAANRHPECINHLLQHNADINAKDLDGRTLLHHAAANGQFDFLKTFLSYNADVNARDNMGITPIHCAPKTSKGYQECVSQLLQHKADVNARDLEGGTLLHQAAADGKINFLKMLLNYHADANAKDSKGKTPLHYAAAQRDRQCIDCLLQHDGNVDTKVIEGGGTLLHQAACDGDFDFLQTLLQYNADVNLKDDCQRTPVLYAAKEKHYDCVRLLLEHNADINVKDNNGSMLHQAAQRGELNFMRTLLGYNPDVNVRDGKGKTPLHISAFFGHLGCLNFLIESKAQVNEKDGIGWTPLFYAAKRGQTKCVQSLLQNSADVNAKDLENNTALHVAHEGARVQQKKDNYVEICRILISAGIDVDALNKDGKTAHQLLHRLY